MHFACFTTMRKNSKFTFFLFSFGLFVWIPFISYAQEDYPSFLHLGKEAGLMHNSYNSFVTKDSRGFVWISSLQGFYRFDGKDVKHFTISTTGNYIENIQSPFFEDGFENLWFTTYDALHYYDRRIDQFKSHQFSKDGLVIDRNYYAFHYNQQNRKLWIRADGNMWAYDTKTKERKTPYLSTQGIRFEFVDSDSAQQIFAFPWRLKPGFEWWTKDQSGTWHMDFQENGVLATAEISDGVYENDSTLWLVSNQGLIHYNLKKKIAQLHRPKGLNNFSLWSAVLYQENLLLLSSRESGLWRFDTQKKSFFSPWKKSEKKLNGISSDAPRELYVDRDSQLWVCHYSMGLDYTTTSLLPFENPLGDNQSFLVKQIIEDHQKRIWVLTKKRGLFIFDVNGVLLNTFEKVNDKSDFSSSHLSIDKEGVLWLIVRNEVFTLQSSKTESLGEWKRVLQGKQDFIGLYHGTLDQKIITNTNGVFQFFERKPELGLSRIPLFDNYRNYEFDFLFKKEEGHFFLPYNNQHLWTANYKDKHFAFEEKLLINAATYDVTRSRDGSKWWVASAKGVYQIDKFGKDSLLIGQKDFKQNCNIYSVIEDHAGRLWLSSDNGIWSYDQTQKSILRYSTANGISSDLFSPDASCLASNGKIWLGNENGLTVFDPDAILLPNSTSQTYIENLWINNKTYQGEFVIDAVDHLPLQHYENTLEFDLRMVGFNQSEKTMIKYRLRNYDNDWSEVKSGSIARFTKIPPGNYVLEAQSINANYQLGKVKELSIHILSPFWKTLWFKILSFILALFFVALIVSLNFRKKLRYQKRLLEKQKTINEERNRIAQELHDEMGGSLSSILFISDDLHRGLDRTTQDSQIERISELTQSALSNMKDIIWALDTSQMNLEDLVFRLEEYAAQYLEDYQVELLFNSTKRLGKGVLLGSEKKRNILLILKESLHNIVKHSQATKVSINISYEKKILRLSIADNGRGFDTQNISLFRGNGLHNMYKRSEMIGGVLDIKSTPNKETVISLSLDV